MATLILSSAGAAVGTALGGPIGAVVGQGLGAAAGSALGGRPVRLGAAHALRRGAAARRRGRRSTSTEGDPIPRVYGRARIGGTLIWATRPLEVANTSVAARRDARQGHGRPEDRHDPLRLLRQPRGRAVRGRDRLRPPDLGRRHGRSTRSASRCGSIPAAPTQEPDPLIVAKEGAENAPAYRGLAYVVFEHLPLADFGNRIPQFAFEVDPPGQRPVRPGPRRRPDPRRRRVRPRSGPRHRRSRPRPDRGGQPAPAPARHRRRSRRSTRCRRCARTCAGSPSWRRGSAPTCAPGPAGWCRKVETRTQARRSRSDWSRRRDRPRPRPRSVSTLPDGTPGLWRHAGRCRADPAGGRAGAPRPGGAALPVRDDGRAGRQRRSPIPRAPGATQPPYPWRGRITCDPAPGLPGSPDGTAAAAAQVAAFFARRIPRRGAALRRSRGAAGRPPACGSRASSSAASSSASPGCAAPPATRPCAALRGLAAAVRARLGPGVALVYGADWTEYGAHVRDGGATVRFPLDDLFADGRHRGGRHRLVSAGLRLARRAGACRPRGGGRHRRPRLPQGPRRVGEAFDWYYADAAGRAAQDRRPITDGAAGKPWIFRAKDLVGVVVEPACRARRRRRDAHAPPGCRWAKPIWLTEVGVPAVDKGTNGPNVFPDPKSPEGAVPAAIPRPAGRADPAPRAGGDARAVRPGGCRASGTADNPVSPALRRPDGRSRAASSSGPGTRGRSPPSRPCAGSGPTPPTGASATGSRAGSRAATSTCWSLEDPGRFRLRRRRLG